MGFDRGNFFSALAGLLVGVMLISVLPAGAGDGDALVMGGLNKATQKTVQKSRNPFYFYSTKAGQPAAVFNVNSGAPIRVNSEVLVENLNADLLDGMEAAAFSTDGHDHGTDYLGIAARAADSALLGGLDAAAFALSAHTHAGYAAALHGHAWADLTGVPGDLADGDDDTLGALSCDPGQIAKRNPGDTAWECSDDLDTDTTLGDGEVFAAVTSQDGTGSGLDADVLDGLGSSAFFGGSVADATGLPLLGATCAFDGGFLVAVARDGSPYCSTPGSAGAFTDSGQALGHDVSIGVGLGDLDGDGDLDAYVTNHGQANRVWLNDGNGTFTDSGQTLGSSNSFRVALGDLDGDGDLDAYVANSNQANRVWLNDGNGTFTDSGQTLGSSNSYGVALGDLDGDGDLDAYVANHAQANRVWVNDGNGVFTDSGQALGTYDNFGVALGDLDGDGDLDAYVTSYGGSGGSRANRVWVNDGNGVFTDSGQALGTNGTFGVGLGDLDGDGDLDAYTANAGSGMASNRVWINDGNGVFTDSGQSLGTNDSVQVGLGDLDGDGDLDAYVANDGGADRVWVNDGNGTFTDSGQTLGTSRSQEVALGDLDGDGDLDAYVGNYEVANRVWLNG